MRRMNLRIAPGALAAPALAALLLSPLAAAAQAAWPARPIRMLVGSPPGGPSDIVTRLFAEHLSQRLKQPVTVENRPGVGNSLAARRHDDGAHPLPRSGPGDAGRAVRGGRLRLPGHAHGAAAREGLVVKRLDINSE